MILAASDVDSEIVSRSMSDLTSPRNEPVYFDWSLFFKLPKLNKDLPELVLVECTLSSSLACEFFVLLRTAFWSKYAEALGVSCSNGAGIWLLLSKQAISILGVSRASDSGSDFTLVLIDSGDARPPAEDPDPGERFGGEVGRFSVSKSSHDQSMFWSVDVENLL